MAHSAMAPLLPRFCVAALVTAIAGASHAAALPSLDGSAHSLRTTWAALQASDDGSTSGDPLRLASTQSSGELGGTLHALVGTPFARMQRALSDPAAWCAVLILDPNVHRCLPRHDRIDVEFGESNAPVAFRFDGVAAEDDYMQVRLTAASGPLGTKDYAIAFEAAPLDSGRSLVHLTFSHRFGVAARIAMAAYFNTVGRNKVGFSIVDRDGAGRPVYVRDMRGGLERNLMRYYLGILAYLDSLSAPGEHQPDRRVRTWLAFTQRYPMQLHEDAGYFERKSPEVRKQHAGE
jgi:hypothetical protein